MNRALGFVLALALVLSACSTEMRVTDISTLQDGAAFHGMPFRMKRAYTVRVFAKQQDGSYKQILLQPQDLPDPDRVYAVASDSGAHSSRTFEVKLRDDSTLESVHVKAEDKTADTVSATATQASAIANAISNYEMKKNDAQIAALKGQLDLRVNVYAVHDGSLLYQLGDLTYAVVVSPDGSLLAASGDRGLPVSLYCLY